MVSMFSIHSANNEIIKTEATSSNPITANFSRITDLGHEPWLLR